MKVFQSIALVAVGAFMIYWAQSHSPEAGIGKVISNELSGSYTMSEPWYYVTMVVGTIIGLAGLVKLYKDMK